MQITDTHHLPMFGWHCLLQFTYHISLTMQSYYSYKYILFLAKFTLTLIPLSTPSVGVYGYSEGEYSFMYKDHFDN